jgi:hypothetical protein
MMIRLIIAGGRDFSDLQYMKREFIKFVGKDTPNEDVCIISGNANGADKLGEKIAYMCDLALEKYPADWDRYGKSAGYRRNEEMAATATHLLAFWDGQSRGTKHMIDIAIASGLEIQVCRY